MIDHDKSEIYVLYLDPKRRREGVGTHLLDYITSIQIEKGAKEQWVSVQKGNHKGIPFYEARDLLRTLRSWLTPMRLKKIIFP